MARGEKVYAANCVACHQATGKGVPPAFPPLDGSKVVTGPKDGQIEHRAERQAGHRDGAVASSCPTPRSPRSSPITRNTWGNKTGDVVQPAEVKAARK